MKDVIDKEYKELCKTGTVQDQKEGSVKEETLDFLGHAFSMAELSDIASFAGRLKKAALSLENREKLPEGTVLMVKVFNHDILVSFAGLAKK